MQKKNILICLLSLYMIGSAMPVTASPLLPLEEWRLSLTHFFPQGLQSRDGTTAGMNDASQGLIFSNQFLRDPLQGRKIQVKGQNRDWTFFAEYQYEALQPAAGMLPRYEIIDLKTQITELGASYRFANRFDTEFEILAGTRYRNQELSSTHAAAGNSQYVENDAWWQNAFVGLRFFTSLSGSWTLVGRGDIGAGKDGQFAWNAVAMLDYNPNNRTSFYLGYKFLEFDYANDLETGMEPYSYTALRQGPFIGMTIRW